MFTFIQVKNFLLRKEERKEQDEDLARLHFTGDWTIYKTHFGHSIVDDYFYVNYWV